MLSSSSLCQCVFAGLNVDSCLLDCFQDFSDANGNFLPTQIRRLLAAGDMAGVMHVTTQCAQQVRNGCCPEGYESYDNQYCRPVGCAPCYCEGRHLSVRARNNVI